MALGMGTIFFIVVCIVISGCLAAFGVHVWRNKINPTSPPQQSTELQTLPPQTTGNDDQDQDQGGVTVTRRISWLSERIMSWFAGQPAAIQQPTVTTEISGPVPVQRATQVPVPSSSNANNQTQASNSGAAGPTSSGNQQSTQVVSPGPSSNGYNNQMVSSGDRAVGPMSTGNDNTAQAEPNKSTSAPEDTEVDEVSEAQVATEDNGAAQTEEEEAVTTTTDDEIPQVVPELRSPESVLDLENIIDHGEKARQRRGFE